jgi:hypothetical protein
MSQVAKKAAALGFLTFVVLWIIGFAHAMTLSYPEPVAWQFAASQSVAGNGQVANNMKQLGFGALALPAILDRPEIEQIEVYEKFAQLAAGTAEFDNDEARVRSILADYKAAVFNERSSGIAPARYLTLEVGVRPEEFDAVVDRLRQVGHLDVANVQRRDRTGEFRKLNAQRQSLKKHLDAIQKLRETKNTTLDDQLRLEQKVQEIEKQLETMGVQLGDLLGKESYYQIYITLSEYQPGSRMDRTYTVSQRMANAFVWAGARWLALVAAVGLMTGTIVSVRTLVRRSPKSS